MERDAEEEQACRRRRNATSLAWPSVLADEIRARDPTVVGAEARGPHDIRDVEHRAVGQFGLAVSDPDDPLVVPLHAHPGQIHAADPEERSSARPHERAHLAADRGADGQHARRQEHEDGPDDPSAPRIDQAEREFTVGVSGEQCAMTRRGLVRDVGTGVAEADHEDRSRLQLGRVPVFARMELHDGGVEASRELRYARAIEGTSRDDHLTGDIPPLSGVDEIATFRTRQRLDAVDVRAADDRKLERLRVRLEVVAHLSPSRVVEARCRKPAAGQAIGDGGAVQAERVPVLAPVVPDPSVGIEDHEGQTPPLQVVAGGQAGLAGADDDCVDRDASGRSVHDPPPISGIGGDQRIAGRHE